MLRTRGGQRASRRGAVPPPPPHESGCHSARARLSECAESPAEAGQKVRSGLQREDAKQNESPRRYVFPFVCSSSGQVSGDGVSAGQRGARLAGSARRWSKIKARTIWWEDWSALRVGFLIIFVVVLKWTEIIIAFIETDMSSAAQHTVKVTAADLQS